MAAIVLALVKSGDVEDLKQFLANGGDEECLRQVDKYGQSMLHLAVEEGHTDMCLYLVEKKKLDVNIRDRNGWTPLHVACSKGDCRLVAVLLATNRCDVTLKTVEDSTVLHYFVRKEPQKGRLWGQESYFVLIKKIIDSGCDPEGQNVNGETAVHAAVSAGKTSVVVYLSRLNVDLNTVNKFGETCLHLAARRGDMDMVQALVALGVDVTVRGENGTALQVAERAGHDNICQVLSQVEPLSVSGKEHYIDQALKRACESDRLNLSNLGLAAIPPRVFELTNLVELDLSHNCIVEVPPAICQLTALKSLKLDDNQLTSLPKEMGEMGWLEDVTLSLNTDLSPTLKRKLRYSVPALLEHLRHDPTAAMVHRPPHPMIKSVGKQGSQGELMLEGLRQETPTEERLIRTLEEKERTLAKKERKLSETIAFIQAREELLKAKEAALASRAAEETNEKESHSKKKQSGGSAVAHDTTSAAAAMPPRRKKSQQHHTESELQRPPLPTAPLSGGGSLLSSRSAEELDSPTIGMRDNNLKAMMIGEALGGVRVAFSSSPHGDRLHLSTSRRENLSLTLEQWYSLLKLIHSVDLRALQAVAAAPSRDVDPP